MVCRNPGERFKEGSAGLGRFKEGSGGCGVAWCRPGVRFKEGSGVSGFTGFRWLSPFSVWPSMLLKGHL